MRRVLFSSILLCILLLVPYANGAKPVESPKGNGGIYFDENPGIVLVDETVTFAQIETDGIPRAKVTVEYNMKNILKQDQRFSIFFVVPEAKKYSPNEYYKAFTGDKKAEAASDYKEIPLPENWTPSFDKGLVEPYSKKVYSTDIDSHGTMFGIEIPVDIRANDVTSLRIEYMCEGGYYKHDDYEHTIYSFMYYLTPARYWNGEPKVRLNVDFGLSGRFKPKFYSNIPMQKMSRGSYSAELTKLPEYEWTFTFVDSKGLIYGTNNSRTHTNTTICFSIALYLAFYAAYRYFHKRYLVIIGYSISVLFLFCFIGKIVDGYICDMFLSFILFVVLALVVPAAYLFPGRRRSSKQM